MNFAYTKNNLPPQEAFKQRLFEILPGATTWIVILGLMILSFFKPALASILIIAFYLYWLLKILYMTIFLVLSFWRLHTEEKTNWKRRMQGLDNLAEEMAFRRLEPTRSFGEWIAQKTHLIELANLRKSNRFPPASKEIYHLILYPIVKENRSIVEPGLQGLLKQDFPTQQMVVFLALEERANPVIKEEILALEKEYKSKFFELRTVIHPTDLEGEAVVKGANTTFAAKKAGAFFEEKKIPAENVIVSCFDADTVASERYFTALTYYFMITPNRLQASFQPIPVYHNNIWDVPGFARVIEAGSSFFQLIEATNPESLVTFSSHSMSFKALIDVDYWPVDMISDDSAIYWKSFIHFNGDYQVVPMYTTISMDIAGSKSIVETARSVYKQKRRWAWGVENFPLVMRAFLKLEKVSLYKKISLLFKLFEGHLTWATGGFLLGIIGWLPVLFARQEYLTSVMYYNVPQISTTILRLATISLITSIILSINLLPKRIKKISLTEKLKHTLEWLTLPFILVFFSSLPAWDAQTRLMLGKYMEFWVTDKRRSS